MAITAALVKELREMTGAGMMDCKKALTEVDGDMEKAVEWLRENGMAKAQKKAGRIAAEGIVMLKVSEDGKKAVAVEVNSETDFVAKNADFRGFVNEIADQILTTDAEDVEAFLAEPWSKEPEKTVSQYVDYWIAVIGEKLSVRRFAKCEVENGFIAAYNHMDGKIGVLVEVETDVVNDAVKEMGENIAMQAAAMRPSYCTSSEIPGDFIEKEREILKATIMNDPVESQKPEKVIEGMIKGRINKELKEIVLLDQVYVKAEDGKQTVSGYVKEVAKENGAAISVKSFVRFETGEGLEKRSENFAEEVAAQAAKVAANAAK
ncbi:MAG: elongation factor Ts [Eubacterium sp.]|nr:elongation factor Ts [Eubacterium sp.]